MNQKSKGKLHKRINSNSGNSNNNQENNSENIASNNQAVNAKSNNDNSNLNSNSNISNYSNKLFINFQELMILDHYNKKLIVLEKSQLLDSDIL